MLHYFQTWLPPKKLLGSGVSTSYTPFCLICIISFKLWTNVHVSFSHIRVSQGSYPTDFSWRVRHQLDSKKLLCGNIFIIWYTICRRPDGVAINEALKTVYILKFKRSTDRDDGFLEVKDAKVNEQHKSIIGALKVAALEWEFEQINFVVGNRGSVVVSDFYAKLKKQKKQSQVSWNQRLKTGRHSFHQCRSAICRETRWPARKWHDNANAAGKRSHDSQSRDARPWRIKLDLANVGADGDHGSATFGICEWRSQWSRKFDTMQWPAYWSNHIFLGTCHHRFHSKHKKETLWWEIRRCAWNAKFGME